uniref:Receptor expression-enhancing protein n=2 Tax=Neognathae TaxID=8825 RepID=A0A8B9DF61_ANSCY
MQEIHLTNQKNNTCLRGSQFNYFFLLFFFSRLIFGTLYPAYYSYKAVKSKDIKEYVKWMMYWIIFALFTTAETFTDIFLCWFPFYYELKIAFVAWLLSPYTKGSSLLYRKFVHPTLSSKEKEIDDCLVQAKDRSYDALVHFGKRGLNVAATAAVMAASKVRVWVGVEALASHPHPLPTAATVWRGRYSGGRDPIADFDHASRSPITSHTGAPWDKDP